MSESNSTTKSGITNLAEPLPNGTASNGTGTRTRKKREQDLQARIEPLEPALPVEIIITSEAQKPEAATVAPGQGIEAVPIEKIQTSRYNFRLDESSEQLHSLAQAIQQHGFWGVLIGRRRGDLVEIAGGERRLRAAELAGLRYVPVQIQDLDDKALFEIALQETFLTESLNPLEEALAIRQMFQNGYTLEDATQRIGRSPEYLNRRMALLKYPEVEEALRNATISPETALELASIEDAPMRNKLLRQVIARKYHATHFVVATIDIPPRLLAAGRSENGHANGVPLWREGAKRDKTRRKTFRNFSLPEQYQRIEGLVDNFVKELSCYNIKGLAKHDDWRKKTRKLLKLVSHEVSDKLEKLD